MRIKVMLALVIMISSLFSSLSAHSLVESIESARPVELRVHLMTPEEILKLLPPYPTQGSIAEQMDLNVMYAYQLKRTPQDCLTATEDDATTLGAMFGGDSGILNPDELQRLRKLVLKVYLGAGVNVLVAKNIFKRPRPYDAHDFLSACIKPERTFAYPSGHSLLVRLMARLISQIYPERTEQLLRRADEYALSRIIGGVHYPSDVRAAFKMADYLATKMIKSKDFALALEQY
jgi:acid phosphatase (class A)